MLELLHVRLHAGRAIASHIGAGAAEAGVARLDGSAVEGRCGARESHT